MWRNAALGLSSCALCVLSKVNLAAFGALQGQPWRHILTTIIGSRTQSASVTLLNTVPKPFKFEQESNQIRLSLNIHLSSAIFDVIFGLISGFPHRRHYILSNLNQQLYAVWVWRPLETTSILLLSLYVLQAIFSILDFFCDFLLISLFLIDCLKITVSKNKCKPIIVLYLLCKTYFSSCISAQRTFRESH